MPPVLPDSRAEQIQWFAARLPAWSAAPAAIGLTPAQVADLGQALGRARDDALAAVVARQAARAATLAHHISGDALRALGGTLIKTIKVFAETTGDPSVYEHALIPRPRPTTSRRPPPEAPTQPVAAITPTGEVTLSWEAPRLPGRADGAGVQYIVYRRLIPPGAPRGREGAGGRGGAMELLGVTGSRRFVDDSIPPGTAGAEYAVEPRRGTAAGPRGPITTVTFPGAPPASTPARCAA